MSRILVTGASGFIGSALTERLLAEGHQVIGSYRKRKPEPKPGARFVQVKGLSKYTDWRPLLNGVDAIVHCAARAHIADRARRGMALQRAANRDAVLALADQAAEAGVKRFVFLSSLGAKVMRRPYQIAKLEAEEILRSLYEDKAMELVILRPPMVVDGAAPGNLPRLAKAIARGIPLPFASLKNRRSLLTRESLIEVILLCLERPEAAGQRFELSEGDPLSTREIAELLAEGLGREAKLYPFPGVLLQILLGAIGRESIGEGLVMNLEADLESIEEVLGWRGTRDVRAAVRTVGAKLAKN